MIRSAFRHLPEPVKNGLRMARLHLPPKTSYRLLFFQRHGYWPHIRRPRTFSEKIAHRKFYEHDPRMPALIDKISVKDFVRDKIGPEWVTPTLWSGKRLPPRHLRTWPTPYVIKANHSSGQIIFVDDAESTDWDAVERETAEWVRHLYGTNHLQQWGDAQVMPRILVEPMIPSEGELTDYKFFVFDGRVHVVQVDTDRYTGHRQSFYDRDWRRQPFQCRYTPAETDAPRPASLDKMIAASEALGAGWPYVRVDLYEASDHPRFGELTFYPRSGLDPIDPIEWDFALGKLWPVRQQPRRR